MNSNYLILYFLTHSYDQGCTNDLYTFVKDVLLFYFEYSTSFTHLIKLIKYILDNKKNYQCKKYLSQHMLMWKPI